MKCAELCKELKVTCPVKKCRYWLDYRKDLNCAFVAVSNNPGGMILQEVGNRIHVTAARAKQIETEAVKKISSSPKALKILQ